MVKKSDTGEDMAHCKLCNTNFSVTAGALYDVKRYAKRSTHVTAVEASSKTKSITNFVDIVQCYIIWDIIQQFCGWIQFAFFTGRPGLTLEGDSDEEVALWLLISICAKREVEVAL